MDRIISNDPTAPTSDSDDWFRHVAADLASLAPGQRRDVEALIHALATGTVTADDVDQAMSDGGTAAVSRLAADSQR